MINKATKNSLIASGCIFLIGTAGYFAANKVNALEEKIPISSADVVKMKQNVIGYMNLTDEELFRYDLNNDGTVNIIDISAALNLVINDTKVTDPVVTTAPPVTSTEETTTVTTAVTKPVAKQIDANMVMQNPELPTGCEVTSLTMLLNFYGFNVSKLTLADNFLPKFNFFYKDNVLYGADYITTFPGNPRSSSGYGCYTPCMVTTAEKYFNYLGNNEYHLRDITGSEFETLLTYVASGRPVMVWATMGMIEPIDTVTWTTPEGKRMTWKGNEHCLLLTGYDKNKGIVYVNDPLRGKVSYVSSVFNLRYIQMGKYAAVLMKEGETVDTGWDNPSSRSHYIGEVVDYNGPVYYSSFGGKSVMIKGRYTITEIIDDESRPYRIRLGTEGWIPYNF